MKFARIFAGMLALLFCLSALAATPQSPSQFLGIQVGADRTLADYKQIAAYFDHLSKTSPRVQIEHLGPSTLGNDMIMAVISSEENLKNKKRYQEIARKMADPRGLTKDQIAALAKEGKAILIVTCNIHATEIGSSQMAMEWAYALATSDDAATRQRLNDVILLLVPSLNPDGQIMETEWYRKNLGTKYEGSRLPYLYHPYTGHDNNRDWFMLTQKESINVTRAVYNEWFPQVWLDEHQMGPTGPRIFVPPYSDPVAENLHPLIFRGVNVIGMNMALRLEEQRKSGVLYGAMYDAYWPAGTKNTAWFKNIIGLLTEVASAKLATPINVASNELSGGGKGLVEPVKTINYLNPWPGGTWRLRDIMDYERIASDAILESVAQHREDFQRNEAAIALDAVNSFKADEAYRIPMEQRDPAAAAKLAQLMKQHNVEVLVEDKTRDFVIPLSQPYGKFVSELLGVQRYPKVKAVPGQNIIAPYDVAAWSLPLMMDVRVEKTSVAPAERARMHAMTDTDAAVGKVLNAAAAKNATLFAVTREANNATHLVNVALKDKHNVWVASQDFTAAGHQFAAGTFIVESNDAQALATKYRVNLTALTSKPAVTLTPMRPVRVGMYKPFLAAVDEGWTRFILEQYEFDLKPIDNKMMKTGNLKAAFDAIILPDMSKEMMLEGKPRQREGAMKYTPDYPDEFAGGMGKEGVKALKDFVEAGGTIVALSHAGDLLADEFNVPVRNALAAARPEEFLCPGSLLRVNVDAKHPVTWGLAPEAAVFVDDGIAYQTAIPSGDLDRQVLAWYPNDAEDILLSGWIRGADQLQRRAAAVAFTQGKGKLVMLGFRSQFRAQTEGTYKFLFNSLLWAGMNDPSPKAGAGD